MPVTYTAAVGTSRPWTFLKLLFRWQGSVWKAVWLQLIVFLVLFYATAAAQTWAMDDQRRATFSRIVAYVNARLSYIPLDLILGFFISAMIERWRYLFQIIGFVDNIALYVSTWVRGDDERAKMYRRNIVRYCVLVQVLVFRDMSLPGRRRFPTLDTVTAAGFWTEEEKKEFDAIQYRYSKYWLPFQWAWALCYRAREEGYIQSDYYQTFLSEEIRQFRTGIAWLCNYDWVPMPLIYPQTVCLAVHLYFLIAVFARQYTDSADNLLDYYFPAMSVIQFCLYMGWLKVAEALLNPWGLDDDDFDVNTLIDRNLAIALKVVDNHGKWPTPKRDAFWDDQWVPMYSNATVPPAASKPPPQTGPTESEAADGMLGTLAHLRLPRSVSTVRMIVPKNLSGGDLLSTATVERPPLKIVDVPVDVHPQDRHAAESSVTMTTHLRQVLGRRLSLAGKSASSASLRPPPATTTTTTSVGFPAALETSSSSGRRATVAGSLRSPKTVFPQKNAEVVEKGKETPPPRERTDKAEKESGDAQK